MISSFFLILEAFSGYLIVQNNNFQRASFINSTNKVAAEVNTMVSAVTEYINLRAANDALSRQNASLRTLIPDVFYIDSALKQLVVDTIHKQQYTFLTAKVVNNSINRRNNYLTLNKGSMQGIKPEMGVVSAEGIVGIVKDVSEHYCSVLSFLHKDTRISARFKKSGYIGSMVWEGQDATHGILTDIAKHVKISLGDTIVTSSFSSIFPEGVMIGTVDEVDPNTGNNFQDIRVKLSTSFGNLTYVYIISNLYKDEQRKLEENQPNDH
ncbi:MAG: rod shape-determining protein MreC [Bacteroidetes bacterium]|nr:rod shape-determining protein MreC [Bacteroidota bacterium]